MKKDSFTVITLLKVPSISSVPLSLTWGGKGVRENFPKSFPPEKVSLVVGFSTVVFNLGGGAAGGHILPAQVHRA